MAEIFDDMQTDDYKNVTDRFVKWRSERQVVKDPGVPMHIFYGSKVVFSAWLVMTVFSSIRHALLITQISDSPTTIQLLLPAVATAPCPFTPLHFL